MSVYRVGYLVPAGARIDQKTDRPVQQRTAVANCN